MPSPVEIIYKKIRPPQVGENGYAGFTPGRWERIKAGSSREGWDGGMAKALPCDIIIDHDVEIVVRDGTRLYADLVRPADYDAKMPFIVSWSPFGKKYSGHHFLPKRPWQCGIRPDDISGYEKFEGMDPAFWCQYGYAIANVDTRGVGDSDGNIEVMGTTDAEDGYDVIEFLAKLPYSNGAVGMAGNSALAISQYFLAAQQPPSLKAIAPWEGCGDLYREQFVRGGIFDMSNFDMIINWILRGKNGVEDFEANYAAHPLMDAYWADKRPDMTKIKIPTYLGGSDHSQLHTMGTVRAWLEIDTPHKWIRWSAWQEWHDLWAMPEHMHELKRFFDRYLKGEENGWETTPKVRISLLRFGDADPVEDLEFNDFPPSEAKYETLYLTSEGLSKQTVAHAETVEYDSTDPQSIASFQHVFSQTTSIVGLPKAHIFLSCAEHDDACVYVRIRKIDKQGLPMINIPYKLDRRPVKKVADLPKELNISLVANRGSVGQLRASHRAIDRQKSIHPQYPYHPHDRIERIAPGEIVELEIGIFHMAAQFEAGEGIQVDVFGINEIYSDLRHLSDPKFANERNKGRHVIHMSAKHPSRVIVPLL